MRTTLTLEPDVAAMLKKEARRTKGSFKDLVNRALRAGLSTPQKPADRPEPFRTTGLNLGPSLVGSLDDIEDLITRGEGEDHK